MQKSYYLAFLSTILLYEYLTTFIKFNDWCLACPVAVVYANNASDRCLDSGATGHEHQQRDAQINRHFSSTRRSERL